MPTHRSLAATYSDAEHWHGKPVQGKDHTIRGGCEACCAGGNYGMQSAQSRSPMQQLSFSHDLRHALPVRLRVQRSLREQHRVLLRRDAQLVVEGVVPDDSLAGWTTGWTDLFHRPTMQASSGTRPDNALLGRLTYDKSSRMHVLHGSSKRSRVWGQHQTTERQIFSMSSQFVTMPCSMGYFSVSTPRLLCASSPT